MTLQGLARPPARHWRAGSRSASASMRPFFRWAASRCWPWRCAGSAHRPNTGRPVSSPRPEDRQRTAHFRSTWTHLGPGNIGEFLGPEPEPAPLRTCLPAASACRPRMTVKNKKPSARKRSSSRLQEESLRPQRPQRTVALRDRRRGRGSGHLPDRQLQPGPELASQAARAAPAVHPAHPRAGAPAQAAGDRFGHGLRWRQPACRQPGHGLSHCRDFFPGGEPLPCRSNPFSASCASAPSPCCTADRPRRPSSWWSA